MPKYVNIPGKGEYEFPDSMSDEQIREIVSPYFNQSFSPFRQKEITEQEPVAPPPEEPSFFGDIFGGLKEGFVGGLETAGIGAAALLPEEAEKKTVDVITSVADYLAPDPEEGDPEASVTRKVSQALGSMLTFFGPGLAGVGIARAAGAGIAASKAAGYGTSGAFASSLGAGEARQRAIAEGATEDEIESATRGGAVIGLSELLPIQRLFRALDAKTVDSISDYATNALKTGGVEGLQEASAQVAQNMLAKEIYKPEQSLIEGSGESAAYGGAAGAIMQTVMDLAFGRKGGRGTTTEEPTETRPPQEEVTPTQEEIIPGETQVYREAKKFVADVENKEIIPEPEEVDAVAASVGVPVDFLNTKGEQKKVDAYFETEEGRAYAQSMGIDPDLFSYEEIKIAGIKKRLEDFEAREAPETAQREPVEEEIQVAPEQRTEYNAAVEADRVAKDPNSNKTEIIDAGREMGLDRDEIIKTPTGKTRTIKEIREYVDSKANAKIGDITGQEQFQLFTEPDVKIQEDIRKQRIEREKQEPLETIVDKTEAEVYQDAKDIVKKYEEAVDNNTPPPTAKEIDEVGNNTGLVGPFRYIEKELFKPENEVVLQDLENITGIDRENLTKTDAKIAALKQHVANFEGREVVRREEETELTPDIIQAKETLKNPKLKRDELLNVGTTLGIPLENLQKQKGIGRTTKNQIRNIIDGEISRKTTQLADNRKRMLEEDAARRAVTPQQLERRGQQKLFDFRKDLVDFEKRDAQKRKEQKAVQKQQEEKQKKQEEIRQRQEERKLATERKRTERERQKASKKVGRELGAAAKGIEKTAQIVGKEAQKREAAKYFPDIKTLPTKLKDLVKRFRYVNQNNILYAGDDFIIAQFVTDSGKTLVGNKAVLGIIDVKKGEFHHMTLNDGLYGKGQIKFLEQMGSAKVQRLKEIYRNIQAKDAFLFKKKPKGPFQGKTRNIVGSENIDPKYVKFLDALTKQLGIKTKIFVATFEDIQNNPEKYNLHGAYNPVRAVAADREKNGATASIGPNLIEDVILLDGNMKERKTLEVLSHELGHIIQKKYWENSSQSTKEAIEKAYEKWLLRTKGKSAKNLIESLRAPATVKTTLRPEHSKMLASEMGNQEYWKSFDEWFADQVSRWVTTQREPLNVVERFFKNLANRLRRAAQLAESLILGKAYRYLPAKEINTFLKEVGNVEISERVANSTPSYSLATPSDINDIVRDIKKGLPENFSSGKKEFFMTLKGATRKAILQFMNVKDIADVWGREISIKIKGKVYYPLQRVAKLFDKQEGETRTNVNMMEKVLENMQQFRTNNKDNNKYDKLNDLFYESTYANLDMSAPPKFVDKNGKDIKKPLRTDFKLKSGALSEAQFRRADQRYKEQREAFIQRQQDYERILPLWNAVGKDGQKIYLEVRDHFKQTYKRLKESLSDRITTDLGITEDDVRKAQSNLNKFFNLNQELNFYFPLKRNGKYWVNFNYMGERVSMSFESKIAQERAYGFLENLQKKEEAKFGTDPIEKFESVGTDQLFSKDNMGLKEIGKIQKIIQENIYGDSKRLTAAEREMLNNINKDLGEFYISSAPEKSIIRSLIAQRQNVLGATGDIIDVFAEHGLSQARQIARLENGQQMDIALKGLKNAIIGLRDSPNQSSYADVVNTIADHVNEVRNPRVGYTIGGMNVLNTIGKAGFFYYLLTPAAAMINIGQTPLVAAPMIAGKYGTQSTIRAVTRAAIDVLRGGFGNRKQVKLKYKTSTGQTLEISETIVGKLSQDESKAMARAYADGLIDRTLTAADTGTTLEGLTPGEVKTTKLGKAVRTVINMFAKAEQFNREATFLAAYRLAKAEPNKLQTGSKFKDPYQYARDITFRSHGDYSTSNSGLAFKNPTYKAFLMFKKYPVFMYYNYYKTAKEAYGKAQRAGFTPEELTQIKAEAHTQLWGMLGTGFMAAGLYGVPGYFVAEWVIGSLFNAIDGEEAPIDPSERIRNFTGEIFYKGPLQAAFGLEVATRLGLGSPIVYNASILDEEANQMFRIIEMIGGPALAMGANTFTVLDRLQDPNVDFLRAIEIGMPLGIRNMLKAARYAEENTATTLKGYTIVDDIGKFQLFAQAMGFTSSDISRQFDLNNARAKLDKYVNKKRLQLITRGMLATLTEDSTEWDDITKDMVSFNNLYPEAPVTFDSFLRSARMRTANIQRNDAYLLGGVTSLNYKLINRYDDYLGRDMNFEFYDDEDESFYT